MKSWERVLGLDLAGSPKRKTGYAFLRNKRLVIGTLYTDEDILQLSKDFELVMVDAPLSLPAGRRGIEDRGPHFRECDLLLKEMGYRFFPISLGPMRMLTERGMRLANILRSKGLEVLETFPGAMYDLFGINRKDKYAILGFYKSLPFDMEDKPYSQDELDAIACWLAGLCYLMDKALVFSGKDGKIVVASGECVSSLPLDKG
ncbi:MAG: DUF429 domain-containing protein [Aquificaceae bacterium]